MTVFPATVPAAFSAAYGLAWNLLLPVVAALARLDGRARKGFGRGFLPRNWRVTERFGAPSTRAAGSGTLWCHCASLGEAKGIWGMVRELVSRESASGEFLPMRIHLTATTSTGLDFLERECGRFRMQASHDGDATTGLPEIYAGIAPFDHAGSVRRFLIAAGVESVCLFETDLWPNYIRVSADLGIPVSLVSARMSVKAQSVYRRFPRTTAGVLGRLAWIQAQSEVDRDRFRALSACPVTTGFDFRALHYLRGYPVPTAPGVSRIAMVSLHLQELRRLLPELPALVERFPVTLFPRHLGELAGFQRLLEPLGFILHSRDAGARNVLVDSMGKVEAILPTCHSAFVGGSLIPLGCHNLWEPLLAGLKIYFGPDYGNQEILAGLLLDKGIAEVVTDVRQLREWREPGPELAAACGQVMEAQKESLDAALLECRERIFATFRAERRNTAVATQLRGREP